MSMNRSITKTAAVAAASLIAAAAPSAILAAPSVARAYRPAAATRVHHSNHPTRKNRHVLLPPPGV
jgi:hypothetical protein